MPGCLMTGTTLSLIRGSNYFENGGHGPRSFTLIEFQYLPLPAWAPGCDLKQLKATHPPRCPWGQAGGAGRGGRQPRGAAQHPGMDPTRHVPGPRTASQVPAPHKPHQEGCGEGDATSAPRAAGAPSAHLRFMLPIKNQKNVRKSKLNAENHKDACGLRKKWKS